MKNYFIFQYEDLVSFKTKFKITVVFIPQASIKSQNILAQELNLFFQENSITDKLVLIVGQYLETSSYEYLTTTKEITFERIPGKSKDYFEKCLIIYQFDSNGNVSLKEGNKPENEKKFLQMLFRSGSTLIFKNNGGLVESTPDHHFVFPSNKHCSKFIRTGNVLINQSEILFLAFQLLKHVQDKNTIYCDTSSINVLPYAVFELRRRFKLDFDCPIIFSFESYDIFESKKESFQPDSLILISSSTSGNIIERILKEKRAEKEQILVVYFLGSLEKFHSHHTNILCNLTKEDEFPLGEDEFDTYSNPNHCELCLNHSRPINISSDVFLTIQPKIERHLLTIKSDYLPKNIGAFVNDYRNDQSKESIFKVYYKDYSPDLNYEIYFDVEFIIENLDKFRKFNDSLERYINKYISANTKYLLHLPDSGSEKLAKYILSKTSHSITPELIKLDKDFTEKITNEKGAVVVVAACIINGKKLLQVSRLMRNHDKLDLIYFTGIFRPINESFGVDLIKDLKKGRNKSDERPFVAVETIYCSILQENTAWELEKIYLEEMIGVIDDADNKKLYDFVNSRLDFLRENKKQKGFNENVFLPQTNGQELRLRKSFAFWDFNYEESNVNQSEVYFTVSTILSNLNTKPINSHPSLKQSNYIRNILSPRNFHRYNDGIIQASILRSGKTAFFAYDLDGESSIQMKDFLLSIIENYNTPDGEAILEFLLAIGIHKLKLKKEDLHEVLNFAISCEDEIISGFSKYVLNDIFKS